MDNSNNGRVFVISPIAKNIEPAREFGDIFYVFNSQLHKAHTKDVAELVEDMYTQFSKYDPARDYFLPVGNSVLNCIASTILCECTEGKIHYLFWEPRTCRYVPLRVDLWEELDRFFPEAGGGAGPTERWVMDAMFGKARR